MAFIETCLSVLGFARHDQGDLTGTIADLEQYLELGGGTRNGERETVEELLVILRKQRRPWWLKWF